MSSSDGLMEDLRHLTQATKVINSTLSVEEQLPLIMDCVTKLTQADRALLLLYNPQGELEIKAERSQNEQRKGTGKYSRSVIDKVLVSGEPLFVLDTDKNETVGQQTSVLALQLRTVMCVPLRSRTGIIGALYVDSISPRRAFNESKKEIFAALADHVAIALNNARLYTASISDPMTGLYNHAYCQRRLQEEFERAARYGRFLSLILLDIDHFKQINDTLGHRRGDEVICRVANILKLSVRNVDIAARYGGDEFALILPETGSPPATPEDSPVNGALLLAERIRQRISEELFEDWNKVTASVGVAVYPDDSDRDLGDLIESADKALYAAKHAGRNQVCRAAPPPSPTST